jgi:predicted ArsR family transcriptional regulator
MNLVVWWVEASMAYRPRAYLSRRRNLRTGLATRTKILNVLEEKPCTAKEASQKIGKNYSSVLRQLHSLRAEGVVDRGGQKPPYVWLTTGIGQQRLNDIVTN